MYEIKLIPKTEMKSIIPFLQILNDKISVEVLNKRIDEMLAINYECVGVYDKHNLIGISGLWILNKYYAGRHIEPDNVVIHPDYRNNGIGELMMKWIYDYAKKNGCDSSELNCYVTNQEGIKFWINQGYKIIGYHFQKMI